MTQLERRLFSVELRATDDGTAPKITGYASVFGKLSEPISGLFREQVAEGAFGPILAGTPDVRALFNHNPDHVLARTLANTLRLKEDRRGLHVDIDPPDTQFARDLMVSIRRGDISGMSIGFTVKRDEWQQPSAGSNALPTRTVLEFGELYDVSVVTTPAFPQTTVSARALTEARSHAAPATDWRTSLAARRQQLERLEAEAGESARLHALAMVRRERDHLLSPPRAARSGRTAEPAPVVFNPAAVEHYRHNLNVTMTNRHRR
jgi:HK97 family phage prohead protease